MFKDYYQLTKPGIIYGNAITAAAGFFLASRGHIHWALFLATIIGISLVIASGCVINNYYDRDIDALMERTKNRPLVRRVISPLNALLYGKLLGIIGFFVLFIYTNILTVSIAMGGLFVYVALYTMLLKRTSIYSTLIGSISGAIPPVVGYLAVTGRIDIGAILLFFILAIWQMPHSFAIAIYRLDDYKRAKISVLPVKKGIPVTKVHMLFYTAVFTCTTFLLSVFGYTSYTYLFTMTILGLMWLGLIAKGFWVKPADDKRWARNVFVFSIIVLLIFSILISFGKFI